MFCKRVRDIRFPTRSTIYVATDNSLKNLLATIVCDRNGITVSNHVNGKECKINDAFIHSIFQISNGPHYDIAINRCLSAVA